MVSVSRESIREAILEFIFTELLPQSERSELTDTTPLISGGIVDSISTVRLVSHLEEKFNIRLEQVDITIQRFDTVERIIETVQGKLTNGTEAS